MFDIDCEIQFFFFFQVRAAENVAAHSSLLRCGEKRKRPGGGIGPKSSTVQTPGKKVVM